MYRLMCTGINTYDGIYYYIVIHCILYILLMSSIYDWSLVKGVKASNKTKFPN